MNGCNRFTDEEVSRLLSEHSIAGIYHGGKYVLPDAVEVAAAAEYDEPAPDRIRRMGTSGWRDRVLERSWMEYRPDWSHEQFVSWLDKQGWL